eukprot:gnl/TRDRNA2_/TRDRNA2_176682_c2_seq3.p1 gnl/TRDRNA2_/TRDRNA2_176682_c2~~gnl/TRDRNA2_/TRDRNA2_176682_c2_seq3.p1  ORF type:complete len:113 (-),score=8.85 gnl/TRDRNA2_/TRDRNA2_176682_c2_seq3:190-528(-)
MRYKCGEFSTYARCGKNPPAKLSSTSETDGQSHSENQEALGMMNTPRALKTMQHQGIQPLAAHRMSRARARETASMRRPGAAWSTVSSHETCKPAGSKEGQTMKSTQRNNEW